MRHKKREIRLLSFAFIHCFLILIMTSNIYGNAATPFTSDKHTVLLLHFDEGKGLPRDSSSCGNNPTVNKAEWLSAGKFGSCLYFDGKS
ncbi:MAG: hypothetical protein PHV82_12085, partial [Victivallaceae bacterium]|nr:hypothetical protein [Victivallaceae bacterium]